MSALHTVSQSTALSDAASTNAAVVTSSDAVLFLHDGVYLACRPEQLQSLSPGAGLYALRCDIQARGLAERLDQRVKLVDYDGFVELCCKYDKVVSWF